jgi:hypothetical protein
MRALLLIIVFFASAAAAQLRTIPVDATRAEIRHVGENIVELNGEREQLSPGATIRDESNRIIVPSAVPAGALVKYARDGVGAVHRVWILSPQEAEADAQRPR